MKKFKVTVQGFTLLEMILVMAIMASILGLLINYGSLRMDQYRRDRAAVQMQQILNAGLAYYVEFGVWPVTCGTKVKLDGSGSGGTLSLLQTNGFLPNQAIYSPWNNTFGPYQIDCGPSTDTNANSYGSFLVAVPTPSATDAQILAGELPIASVDTSTNTVVAQVPVPGQNLNNARSVNYSGVYYSGACVPVPTCPSGMSPEIVTVPEGVAGVYDAPVQTDSSGNPTSTPCTQSPVIQSDGSVTSTDCGYIASYPITSYEAYAYGGTNITPVACDSANPTTDPGATCYSDVATGGTTYNAITTTATSYWRVCLKVGSEKGPVNPQITAGGTSPSASNNQLFWTQAMGKIVVFTRCVPGGGEPTGSSLNIWSP